MGSKRFANRILSAFILFVFPFGAHAAAGSVELKDEKDRINYSVGYQIGGDFKKQGVNLNPEALVQGIRDALNETQPLMTREDMESTLVALKKKIMALQETPPKAMAEKYRGEGREFLVKNAARDGVTTLPSGLQYKVDKTGSGRRPGLKDTVIVNYRGTLVDGTEFDSSYRKNGPAAFSLTDVIPGWREALPMMKEGARWQLFIPADLAFGERGPLADRVVIYEVELVSVQASP
jgi:FKBP-type peptidyl-prolyl cis-trans isomerase FklB